MFSRLLRNSALSAAAYAAAAILNLLLVPIIVGAYGLGVYGLILLVRVFLPWGVMAFADAGVSETGTLVIARARASGRWDAASRQVILLLAISIAVGAAVGAALLVSAPHLPGWFQVSIDLRPSFERILRVTALSLVVFYPMLLLEGIVKGFERFGARRLLEVLATCAYVLGSIAVVRFGEPYTTVAYLFLAVYLSKYVLLAICAWPDLRRLSWRMPNAVDERDEVWRRAGQMLQNKILGAFQTQLPPVLIGFIVGPAGVGIYDVLTRVPRALKAVLWPLTSALLPVSALLEETGDRTRQQRLGYIGLAFIPPAVFPILFGAAVFSRELLQIWLGPDLVHLWPWLSVMFLIPAANLVLSFGQTLLQVRSEFLARSNRLLLLQNVVQLGASLALVASLQERAFIAGQIAGLLVGFPLQLRLLARSQDLNIAAVWGVLARQAMIAVPLAVVTFLARQEGAIDGTWTFAAAYAVWCIAYWIGAYVLALSRPDRLVVRRMVRTAWGSYSS